MEILEYIARDKPGAAAKFVQKLKDACWTLAKTPTMAPLREELAPGLRAWPVGNYIIFYRKAPDGIEVVRVVHGARDLGKLFDD